MEEKQHCCKSSACHSFMLLVGIFMTLLGAVMLGIDVPKKLIEVVMNKVIIYLFIINCKYVAHNAMC